MVRPVAGRSTGKVLVPCKHRGGMKQGVCQGQIIAQLADRPDMKGKTLAAWQHAREKEMHVDRTRKCMRRKCVQRRPSLSPPFAPCTMRLLPFLQTHTQGQSVRVTRSGPNWVCLCQKKQAMEGNLQGRRVKSGEQAGGGHTHSPHTNMYCVRVEARVHSA
eukprot:365810-Chlamydomonas_euryale.AAC.30